MDTIQLICRNELYNAQYYVVVSCFPKLIIFCDLCERIVHMHALHHWRGSGQANLGLGPPKHYLIYRLIIIVQYFVVI